MGSLLRLCKALTHKMLLGSVIPEGNGLPNRARRLPLARGALGRVQRADNRRATGMAEDTNRQVTACTRTGHLSLVTDRRKPSALPRHPAPPAVAAA